MLASTNTGLAANEALPETAAEKEGGHCVKQSSVGSPFLSLLTCVFSPVFSLSKSALSFMIHLCTERTGKRQH